MRDLAGARNEASHPGRTDLDREYVMSRFRDMADILKAIGAAKTAGAIETDIATRAT